MVSPDRQPPPPESELPDAIDAFLGGDADAADRIARILAGPLGLAARDFLGPGHPDLDDVVQDAQLAVLRYLERAGGFEGNLVTFAVTVARNRCRNLLNWRRRFPHVAIDSMADWLANPQRSPLDLVQERDVADLLQRVLDELGPVCRDLLRAFYLDEVEAETIRRRCGLRTVQGVYYRKSVCLARAYRRLNRLLAVCSSATD